MKNKPPQQTLPQTPQAVPTNRRGPRVAPQVQVQQQPNDYNMLQ